MRNTLLYTCLLAALAMPASAAPAASAEPSAPANAAVITLHAGSKTSDIQGSDASIFRFVVTKGTVQVVILNSKSKAQHPTVRFLELNAPNYDVYVDGSLIGSQSREVLEAGLPLDLKGCVLLDQRAPIQRIAEGADVLLKEIRDSTHPDVSFLTAILANVRMWSRNADSRIRNSGGTHILLNPTGVAVAAPTIWTLIEPDAVRNGTGKYWKAINFERSLIYRDIKDYTLRNRALAAITPVDLTVAREPCEKSAKLTCRITNKCESALSGKLVLETPKGSKSVPSARFSLDRGKSFDAAFDISGLTPAAQGGALTVRAEIRIGPVGFIQRATISGK